MKLYIKNMVCSRCKMVVKSTFEKLRLHPLQVELGEIEIMENDISAVKEQLIQELQSLDFDLLDDKKTKSIEKVKNLITDLVQNKSNNIDVKLSKYLSRELHQNYNSLNNLFSKVKN